MNLKKKVFTSEIRAIDEKEMTLTAAISTDAIDRMGEVLDPAGIDLKNYRNNPVVLWAHDYSQLPIGKAMWVRKDGNAIVSKVQFAKHAFAQEVFNLYKDGYMKAFSVGFIPKDGVAGDGKKGPRWTYTKWELLEYSAVPVPANPEAIALAMSKGILKTASLKTALETPAVEEAQEIDEWAEQKPEVKDAEEGAKAEEVVEVVTEEKATGMEELIAENTQLIQSVKSLEDQIVDLKYKIFVLLNQETKEKTLSEITGDELGEKFHKIVTGVIRKAQGKSDQY